MRARLDSVEGAQREPIAIVGMSGRFPGAPTCDDLWSLLDSQTDAVTEIPEERWSMSQYFDENPNAPGRMNAKHGGFLENVDRFDADFFGIPAREAVKTDPQQRLLLEVTWEALEHAGIAPSGLAGSRTGTYIGINQMDYVLPQLAEEAEMDIYTTTGNGFCFASGRLSYTLGLQGPNMAIDTACSSSLVAVHLACQALRARECHMALACGVQLNLSPTFHLLLAKTQSLSPSGRCNTFSAAADGLIMGEGCAVVVLKRLSDAFSNDDNILAVVPGSAVNHGGSASAITVPNELAQEALVRQALAAADVAPAEVDYVETHGTGTPLGDPIEVGGLSSVFGDRPSDRPLVLGALKTNIGHLDAAAGIAGLVKVVLSLQHERIPANLHLGTPNPRIDWDAWPVSLPKTSLEWRRGERRRIAGVSAFGFSGTNAHVVLAEAPAREARPHRIDRPLHLFTLSATNADALRDLASAHVESLGSDLAPVGDLCFTANAGRSHFPHRLAIVGDSSTALQAHLQAWLDGDDTQIHHGHVGREGAAIRPALLFGGATPGFGIAQLTSDTDQRLYAYCPAYRTTVDHCIEILGNSVPADSQADFDTARFIHDYGLAKLLEAWAVVPAAVGGIGIGGITAACIASVFTLDAALAFVAHRNGAEKGLSPPEGKVPGVRVLSDVTGTWLSGESPPEADYWCQQLDAGQPDEDWLAAFTEREIRHALQISDLGAQPPAAMKLLNAGTVDDEWQALLDALAELYVGGADINWAAVDADYGRRRVPLPTYPFQRRRYWFGDIISKSKEPVAVSTPAPAPTKEDAAVAGIATTELPTLTRIMGQQLQTASTAISQVVAKQLDYLRTNGLQTVEAAATPVAKDSDPKVAPPIDDDWQLLLLSAEDDVRLDQATHDLVQRLRDGQSLAAEATALRQAPPFSHRRMLVAQNAEDAAQALADVDPKRVTTLTHTPRGRSLTFLFPGVGDHYEGMARGLYNSESVFREHLDHTLELMASELGEDLRCVLYPATVSPSSASSDGFDLRRMLRRPGAAADNGADNNAATAKLDRTLFNQPAVFAIEYALAKLWMSWGLVPDALVGYSVGEYVVACLAGVMSLEDAVKLLTGRARLIDAMPPGAMLAVPLSEAALLPLLADTKGLSISIISTPVVCVVGGEPDAIDNLAERLQQQDVVSRSLPTTHAFHSQMLDELRAPIAELASTIELSAPQIPFLSNVTGTWITAAAATSATYWADHTCRTVRFADCVGELLRTPGRVLLEVGPGQNLGSFVFQHESYRQAEDVVILATLRNAYDGQPDRAFLLKSLGKLWLSGIPLDWSKIP